MRGGGGAQLTARAEPLRAPRPPTPAAWAPPPPAGSVRPPVSRATYKRAAAPGGPRDPTGCWPYKSSRTSLRETEKMREQMDVYCRPDGNGGGSIDPAWREQKQAEDRQLNASAPRPPPQRKFGAGAGAAS
jgi:hypothetical protein